MRQMEYVVKAVTIPINDVIGKRVTNKYPVPLQITLAALLRCEILISKCFGSCSSSGNASSNLGKSPKSGSKNRPSGLTDIRADDLRERDRYCLHRLEVADRESV